jgi:hypothetical protein
MHNPIEQSNDQEQACVDRMRQLPTEMLPPYNWQEFRRRARQRLPSSGDRLNWRRTAAAAALLLVVCAIAVWGRFGSGRQVSGSASDVRTSRAGVDAPARSRGGTVSEARSRADADAQAFDAALAAIRSRAIESWLATLPREPVVMRVGTRAAVARLEDRIAQVDDLLTSVRLDGIRQDRLAALQQERVRLVGSLAQVRYAEVVAAESP